MARLYANENFPVEVVERLRVLGHDVLTTHEVGKSNQSIEDDAVLRFAIESGRCVITINRHGPRGHYCLHGEPRLCGVRGQD